LQITVYLKVLTCIT